MYKDLEKASAKFDQEKEKLLSENEELKNKVSELEGKNDAFTAEIEKVKKDAENSKLTDGEIQETELLMHESQF